MPQLESPSPSLEMTPLQEVRISSKAGDKEHAGTSGQQDAALVANACLALGLRRVVRLYGSEFLLMIPLLVRETQERHNKNSFSRSNCSSQTTGLDIFPSPLSLLCKKYYLVRSILLIFLYSVLVLISFSLCPKLSLETPSAAFGAHSCCLQYVWSSRISFVFRTLTLGLLYDPWHNNIVKVVHVVHGYVFAHT